MTLVRSLKNQAAEVIAYEVNMLRYCHGCLVPIPPTDQEERNVYLEAYLVHFRALLEFFAHPRNRVRRTDLSVRRPTDWATRPVTEAEIHQVTSLAEPLHATWFDTISQQLSHCTQPRYEQKQSWAIASMHTEMEKVIAAFDALHAT